MKGVLISILINSILTVSILVRDDLGDKFQTIVFLILMIFVVLSIIGTILYNSSKKRIYGTIAIVGFAVFIPVGAIGIISIRKLMDNNLRAEYKKEDIK